MRQSSKQSQHTTIASVQLYHGGNFRNEAYAFQGYTKNKYYTSDRVIELTDNYERADGKPLKGYGLEIETECNGIENQTVLAEVYEKIIFPKFPTDLFKMQNDGSLGGDSSAECITQIMTREAIRNNYNAFKTMFDVYFPAFGISAADSGRCGMHVNISLGCFGSSAVAQADAVRKLYYIINHHYYLMCSAFRRNPDRTHYAARMDDNINHAKTMDLTAQLCSHGVCFNLGHYNAGRVEIRLVSGQKNYAAFRNTMETVFFLVDRVKTISWAACDSPAAIFEGCNNYVFSRLSLCRDENRLTDDDLELIRPTVKTVDYI